MDAGQNPTTIIQFDVGQNPTTIIQIDAGQNPDAPGTTCCGTKS